MEVTETNKRKLEFQNKKCTIPGLNDQFELLPAKRSKQLELRAYQKELAQLAVEGKNVIICAPPGSGKTYVAIHILQNYLETKGNTGEGVLFFTPGGPLAKQQKEKIEQYLPADFRVDSVYGASDSPSLEMHKADVVVLTPQILINALKSKDRGNSIKSICQYGLLIFDECHHCLKGHSYNAVMREYLRSKNRKSAQSLPQVIGLTATIGTGKSTDITEAIYQLCANLDAVDGIVTVQDPTNLAEMNHMIPRPIEDTTAIDCRTPDAFHFTLTAVMEEFRQACQNTLECTAVPYKDVDDNYEAFKQWCVNTKNDLGKACGNNGRDTFSCVEHIEVCGEAKDLHRKFRPIDALNLLQTFKESRDDATNLTENELRLHEKLTDVISSLQESLKRDERPNETLVDIEQLIVDIFKQNSDSKGLFMVQKRNYANSAKQWMNDSINLKLLNAEVFTGIGGELSRKQQESVMKKFREGAHKILICTPEAAGEGMDVKECNFVINYDYMKSETAFEQIMGRVRKSGGEVYQYSSPKVLLRDSYNFQKSRLIKKATAEIQKVNHDRYLEKIAALQKDANEKESWALMQKLRLGAPNSGKEFYLRCRKCGIQMCSSKDTRVTEDGKHIVVDGDFKGKYVQKTHPRMKPMGPEWEKKCKVHCKECSYEWGIEATWKGCVTFALITVRGITIVDVGGKIPPATPSKWVDAPFRPIEKDLTDILMEIEPADNA